MSILNLTQHQATPEQVQAGVVNAPDEIHNIIKRLLTFDDLPTAEFLAQRATAVADIATDMGATHVLIGGAPFFMAPLEKALKGNGIQPLYAFSQRVSMETLNEQGEVIKTNVFKHMGFVAV